MQATFAQNFVFTGKVMTVTHKEEHESWWHHWGGWIISGIELVAAVGASFLTAGAASPLIGVVVGTGIAAAGGAAQLGNLAAQGDEITALDWGLNLGSIALPGVGHVASKAIGGTIFKLTGRTGLLMRNVGKSAAKEVGSSMGKSIGKTLKPIYKDMMKSRIKDIPWKTALKADTKGLAAKALGTVSAKSVHTLETLSPKVLSRLGQKSLEKIGEEALSDTVMALEKQFGREVIRDLFERFARLSATGDRKAIMKFLSSLDPLIKQAVLDMAAVTAIEKGSSKAIKKILKAELKVIERANIWTRVKNHYVGQVRALKSVFRENIAEHGRLKGIFKAMSSSTFNDVLVQRAQLGDVHDLFRVPSETLYRAASRKITSKINKLKPLFKWGVKIDKMAGKAEGFIPVDSSWILGYRIIIDELAQKYIQISFKTMESNGKKPVYAWVSPLAIASFEADPGKYYLKHIAKKAFWLKGPFASVLGFIPVGFLKNVLSLASNFTQVGMSLFKGTFTNNYGHIGLRTMLGNSLNRVGRLSGRVIAGGLASKIFGHKIGSFIGRELQMLTSAVGHATTMVAMEGKTFSGAFKNSMRNFTTKSINSTGKKILKRHGIRTSGMMLGQVKRKKSFVTRIPGAFTGQTYGSRKLKKLF